MFVLFLISNNHLNCTQTIQKYWQRKTQDEDKQNRRHNTENQSDEQHWPHPRSRWTQVLTLTPPKVEVTQVLTLTPPKVEVNPGAHKGWAVPASYKTPAVLLIYTVKSSYKTPTVLLIL